MVKMNEEEIRNMVYLAIKGNTEFSGDLIDLAEKKLTGEFDGSNFIYSIDGVENIVPRTRIWNSLISEATGETEEEYLKNISNLIELYKFPKKLLRYVTYVNPESKEVKNYITGIRIF